MYAEKLQGSKEFHSVGVSYGCQTFFLDVAYFAAKCRKRRDVDGDAIIFWSCVSPAAFRNKVRSKEHIHEDEAIV